jgi:hypothetical protein
MEEHLDEGEHWTLGELQRSRWNVLDLITIIARRTQPAYLFTDIDVTGAESLRSRLAAHGVKITITAILLKAISIAQLAHPASRSFQLASGIRVTEKEPIAGFTVERTVEGQPVVFFAVIRAAHEKSLEAIGEELENYGKSRISEVPQLAKEVALTRFPWFLRQVGIWIGTRIATIRRIVNPATFGLTSLGKLGVKSLLAPNVSTCIFGVGTVEKRAVAINNQVEVRKMMTLTLAVDTKVMNMGDAADMLSEIKVLIENGLADNLDPSERLPEIRTIPSDKADNGLSVPSRCA